MPNKAKPQVVLNSELIRKISSITDYHIYEVEDVLNGFTRAVAAYLEEGKEIRMEHLFGISPKLLAPREYVHPSTKELTKTEGSAGLSIRPSASLKAKLQGLLKK